TETAGEADKESVAALLVLGFFTGSLTGMLGIGGGFILTPGFMLICGVSPQIAVGTTMLAMLPLSLSGGLIKLYQGYVNLPAGIFLGLGTALGAQGGVWLSSRMSATLLKAIFTVLFTLLAIDYLFPLLIH
ncbi:MAG TPA: sulfite exporter TauE/SafE family protein, partial [Syntrophomonas sp.]|nr:sulfite exporter TauE/SafE family protein [Syntrophomonas sp.]